MAHYIDAQNSCQNRNTHKTVIRGQRNLQCQSSLAAITSHYVVIQSRDKSRKTALDTEIIKCQNNRKIRKSET